MAHPLDEYNTLVIYSGILEVSSLMVALTGQYFFYLVCGSLVT